MICGGCNENEGNESERWLGELNHVFFFFFFQYLLIPGLGKTNSEATSLI